MNLLQIVLILLMLAISSFTILSRKIAGIRNFSKWVYSIILLLCALSALVSINIFIIHLYFEKELTVIFSLLVLAALNIMGFMSGFGLNKIKAIKSNVIK